MEFKKILKQKIDDLVSIVINDEIISREMLEEDWLELNKQLIYYNNLIEKNDYNDLQMSLLVDNIIKIASPKKYAEKLLKEAEMLENKEREDSEYFDLKTRSRKNSKLIDSSGIFELDSNNLSYLKGYNEPLPALLINALLDAKYNHNSSYSFSSLINFWKWLMLNPDKEVRKDLFKWLNTSKFSITEQGMVISYRNVDIKKGSNENISYQNLITSSYLKIKKDKQNVNKYELYLDKENPKKHYLYCTKLKTPIEKLIDLTKYEFKGTIKELYDKETSENISKVIYTDHYTKKMSIELGIPVSLPRNECDNNPKADCSKGLHQKSSKYNLTLGSEVIVCLVNPYNIVAIPSYDNSKFRCCEYLPISKAEIKDNQLVEVYEGTYDFDYSNYTVETLENMIKNYKLDGSQINTNIDISEIEAIINSMKEIISTRKIKI